MPVEADVRPNTDGIVEGRPPTKQESLLVRGGSPRLEPWGDVTQEAAS